MTALVASMVGVIAKLAWLSYQDSRATKPIRVVIEPDLHMMYGGKNGPAMEGRVTTRWGERSKEGAPLEHRRETTVSADWQ